LQKIGQVENFTYKAKMQKNMQPDTQTNMHNTYQNIVPSAKVKQAKKCITNFAILKAKKTETGHREKNEASAKYA